MSKNQVMASVLAIAALLAGSIVIGRQNPIGVKNIAQPQELASATLAPLAKSPGSADVLSRLNKLSPENLAELRALAPQDLAELKMLQPDVVEKVNSLSPQDQMKVLNDPLFVYYMLGIRSHADRARYFDSWVDGLKDNFCRELLHEVAKQTYDADGIKKLNLPAAQAGCPQGVPLADTLKYVNTKLFGAFDDPFTAIMSPEFGKAVQEKLTGTSHLVGGLGMVFTVDQSRTLPDLPNTANRPSAGGHPAKKRYQFNGNIYHVVSGSPAEAAGLEDGDFVYKVNDEDVAGQDSDHVIGDLLLGKVDSKVKLTVKRGADEFERTLTRGIVKPDAVWTRFLKDGYYAIIVSEWRENVSGEILGAMQKAMDNGARGFILDYRLNGGGLWDEAILATSYAVENGVLVTSRERIADGDPSHPAYLSVTWERRNGQLFKVSKNEKTGQVNEQHLMVQISSIDKATGKEEDVRSIDVPFLKGLPPVVVLGNGGSASASEVAIGALMKNKIFDIEQRKFQGATFIGPATGTFGKGIEQNNGPGPMRTRISVTSGRYFLKDGTWPGDAYKHRNPLHPEIAVEEPLDAVLYTANDAQLNAGVDFLKKANAELDKNKSAAH